MTAGELIPSHSFLVCLLKKYVCAQFLQNVSDIFLSQISVLLALAKLRVINTLFEMFHY